MSRVVGKLLSWLLVPVAGIMARIIHSDWEDSENVGPGL